jgi:hypothetical protein
MCTEYTSSYLADWIKAKPCTGFTLGRAMPSNESFPFLRPAGYPGSDYDRFWCAILLFFEPVFSVHANELARLVECVED